jgi:hypothetical protein
MLQLANSGNIEIVADKKRNGHDNISCKLLSDKLRDDVFEEYNFVGDKADSVADLRQESREEPSENGDDEDEVVIKKRASSKSKRGKKQANGKSKKTNPRKKADVDKENIFNGSRPLEVTE